MNSRQVSFLYFLNTVWDSSSVRPNERMSFKITSYIFKFWINEYKITL